MSSLSEGSALYDRPGAGIYFLSHSVGLMPTSTKQVIESAFLNNWHQGCEHIWPLWLENIDQFKTSLGRLFNADKNTFCPQVNVSSGLTKVINALPLRQGKRTILISEHDFPSTSFVMQQAVKLGYGIKRIPKHLNHQDVNVWNEFITEDVGCVFITHVHYNTNQLIPVAEISQIVRSRGGLSIVDVAQSAGIVPINLKSWHVDIVLGSCIKWLCGGPGAGFLWIEPELIRSMEPTDVGWFSHENPFEFDANHFEYAPDSTRFWGGTPSILPFAIATNSIEQQLSIGIENIRRHNQALCNAIMNHVDENSIVSPLDVKNKGGTLVLKFEHQTALVKRFDDARIMCDSREYGLRLSPHIYNDKHEINKLISCF